MTKLILSLIASSVLVSCGFEVVDTGNRGIQIRYGEVIGEPLPEGFYWYNPFTTSIKEFNVQETKWEAVTPIFTKDTQRVDVTFAVRYHPEYALVGKLFREVGREHDLAEKVVQPMVVGALKDAVGRVIADELVSKREDVKNSALLEVREHLRERGVNVTDLQFTNLDFDDAYEKAVEEKVVATQDAQKAKNVSVQIAEQAKQTVMTAQAAAEAMRIKSQALAQNHGLVEFEAVQKWDGALPQIILGGGSIPFIDMKSITGSKKAKNGGEATGEVAFR